MRKALRDICADLTSRGASAKIRDVNGNTVGAWTFVDDAGNEASDDAADEG